MGVRIKFLSLVLLLNILIGCSGGFKSQGLDSGSFDSGSNGLPSTATLLSGDGSSGAPAGPAPFPILLNNYKMRPTWNVAGVDYAVGIPAGTTLSDPSTINIVGVKVDAKNHVVSVNAPMVTLDKTDFSLDGGWQLNIGDQANADGLTVTNSKFGVGINGLSMINQINGANTTFQNDLINGNSLRDDKQGAAFTLTSGATIEYCLVENIFGDFIDGGLTNTIAYNVFDNNGQGPESNPAWLRLGAGTFNQVFDYNTFIQTASTGGPGSAGLELGASGLVASAEVAFNTVVAQANSEVGFFVSVNPAHVSVLVSVHDNYVNPTGMTTFSQASSMGTTSTFSDNYNLLTGALMPQNQTSMSIAVASPATGTIALGSTITLTVQITDIVTVVGSPTLSLNDGGTATYTGGSGTNALTFTYMVGATDSAVMALAITQVNLPAGTTIEDSSGNAVPSGSGVLLPFTGLVINP